MALYLVPYTKENWREGCLGGRKAFYVKSQNQFVFFPAVCKIVGFTTPFSSMEMEYDPVI